MNLKFCDFGLVFGYCGFSRLDGSFCGSFFANNVDLGLGGFMVISWVYGGLVLLLYQC